MKIGIIGAALTHPRTFGKPIQDLHLAEIVGLWSEEQHRESCEKFAAELRVPVASSADEVMDRADAVIVTTETWRHAEYTHRALAKGKPVFVNKPMAPTYQDALSMVEAARVAGQPIMSCSARRYTPAFATIADEVRSGRAGRPVSAIRYEPHGVIPGGWQDRPETSGGFIFNFGVHVVDTLQRVLGPVAKEVNCFAGKVSIPDVATHDTAIITIRFANGAVGTGEVIGSITANEKMPTAPTLRVFCAENSFECRMDENQAYEFAGPRFGVSPYLAALRGEYDTMKAFVHMVETGEPAIPYEETLEVIRILEAARTSVEEKRRVSLAEI